MLILTFVTKVLHFDSQRHSSYPMKANNSKQSPIRRFDSSDRLEMGFDSSRFVGVSQESHLICSLCKKIFDNPVISYCGHSFCKTCIEKEVQHNRKECPRCRLRLRKPSKKEKNNISNAVLIRGKAKVYAFSRNLDLSQVIKNLMVKCDYDFNGCKTVVKFDNNFNSIIAHMKSCSHKLCVKCRLSSSDDHNCFQLMINDRNDWKEKCRQKEEVIEELERKFNHMMAIEDKEELSDETDVDRLETMKSRRSFCADGHWQRSDSQNARVIASLRKMF